MRDPILQHVFISPPPVRDYTLILVVICVIGYCQATQKYVQINQYWVTPTHYKCWWYLRLTDRLTNMILFINPVPLSDRLWCIYSRHLLKRWWQNEKLLMMSNFSFCHNFSTFFSVILLSFIEIFYIFVWVFFKLSNMIWCTVKLV